MKEFWEKVKDFLHQFIDYILILGIIAIVVLVIAWRLDLLFDSNDKKDNTAKDNTKQIEMEKDDSKKDTNQDKDLDSDKKKDTPKKETKDEIEINIPDGSVSTTIADILKENDLIDDTKVFLELAEDGGYATKLKAGDYTIKTDSSMEEILDIITR